MQSQSKILKWSLIFGIVIVTNLFVNYSISLVYSAPQYNDFCKQSQVVMTPSTQSDCVTGGGQWVTTPFDPTQYGATLATPTTAPNIPTVQKISGYCNPDYTCSNNFTTAQSTYDRNVFITLVAVGVVLIVLSFFTKANVVLGTALSFSGVLSLVIASFRYWSSAYGWMRVLILAIALAALIILAMRKFKNENIRS